MGFTGAGITTTGVTGSATLDQCSYDCRCTNNTVYNFSGNAAGLKVKYSGLGADASVFYGQSLIRKTYIIYFNSLTQSVVQLSTRITALIKKCHLKYL